MKKLYWDDAKKQVVSKLPEKPVEPDKNAELVAVLQEIKECINDKTMPDSIEARVGGMETIVQVLVKALAEGFSTIQSEQVHTKAAIKELTEVIKAPKRIKRDKNGKPIGIE